MMRPLHVYQIEVLGILVLAYSLSIHVAHIHQVEAFGTIQTSALSSSKTHHDNNDSCDDDDDDSSTLRRIFTNDVPLLDVRAQVEFSKGAFPTSVNIPILNDEQRHLVGTCYKQQGAKAAFALGKELVEPCKEQRVMAWAKFAQANPTGYMYCFRGGSRSQISQLGLQQEAGIDYPRVKGGYKRMRQFLLDELENIQDMPIVMIGGRTGSGKTHLLRQLATHYHHVDLEGLANHRGSVFGALITPQPTQINFENALAIEFLKLQQDQQPHQRQHQSSSRSSRHPILMEEEGRRIGQKTLPLSMHAAMLEKYPVVEMETPMEERIQICIQDYITDMFPLFQATYSNDHNDNNNDDDDDRAAHEAFRHVHLNSLSRIKNKVPHYNVVYEQVNRAFDLFQATGDASGFAESIEAMLQYYDKMYDYQAANRKGGVLFRGDRKAILEWVQSEVGQQKLSKVCNPSTLSL